MRLETTISQPEGAATRPPLLIAHGLFGSARNWGGMARRFAAGGRRVLSVDMRHHGANPPAPPGGYPALAADLADTLAAEAGGPADVLGHSMGGKAAMTLALSDPDRVRRLVVADIAPVAYGHTHQPHIDAMRALDLSAVARRGQADAMLADAIPDRALRLFLLHNLALGEGGARWRLDLDALSAEMPALIGFPDLDARFDGPALFLAGGASDYLTPAHHDRIRALFPQAEFAVLEGAGHWLHVEQPGPFAQRATAFLDR